MFHLYQSHSLEKLAQRFIEKAGEGFPENPLQQPWVIVQNNEVKEWLLLKMAGQQGIAGNVRFIFPSEFLWVMYRLQQPDVPEQLPGDLNAMQWALFEMLSEEPGQLTDIPLYNRGSNSHQNLFHFCARLADNFDQYQMYRPAMMEGWLQGKAFTKSRHEKWQMKLWQQLNERWEASPKTQGLPRRSAAFIELSRWLKSDEAFMQQLPDHIFVFGLSHAPKPFIEITSLIGKTKAVHYFLRYQGEMGEDDGNVIPPELRQKWDKPLREQEKLIEDITEAVGLELDRHHRAVEDAGLAEPVVHACHNKRREVEVLKDEILAFLEQHPEYSVDDVLVMVPDAREYAGVLESVFSNDEQEPGLPVARLLGGDRESVGYALSRLLELLGSDYKASAVLEFLQLDPVREHFGFTESELDTLEEWAVENHIFWGLGERFNELYSWQKGINQLLAGYSMEVPDTQVFEGMIPYGAVISSGDAELSARFSDFVHTLKQAGEEAKRPKTTVGWVDCCSQWLQVFMGGAAEHEVQLTRMQTLLGKLREQLQLAENRQPVSFGLMKNWLQSQLNGENSVTARYGQGIRVSSYVPYRSVPFAFIGVLGMNEDIFPRKAIRPEFDLIHEAPRPGDRVLKEDDSCLFLEILESAREQLHISYQAFSQRSDAQRLPSILVQQLMEQLHEKPEEHIRKHKLHAFNAAYFKPGSPGTYSSLRKTLAEKLQIRGQGHPVFLDENVQSGFAFGESNIEINNLIKFFTHPSKFFVQDVLGLHDYDNFQEVSDREPFDLDGLQKYQLKAFLADSAMLNIPHEQRYSYAQSYPLIPEALQGKKIFEDTDEKVQEYLSEVEHYTTTPERHAEIDLEVDGIRIQGTIGGLYGDKLVHFRPASRKPKNEISWWLQALLLKKAGLPLESMVYISIERKDSVKSVEYSAENLRTDWLDELLDWVLRAEPWLHKLCFFPETSRAYIDELNKKGDEVAAFKKAQNTWEPNFNDLPSESEDFYNGLIWNGINFLEMSSFREHARKIWEPFLEATGEQADD